MTILGIAGCTGLLVMGFGIRDSLQGIGKIQYSEVLKNDVIALKNRHVNKAEQQKLDKIFTGSDVTQANAVQYQQLTKHLSNNGATENIMLIAPQSTKNFNKSINLRERQSKKKLNLSNNGVVISEKLAHILNVKKGATISLKDAHGKLLRFKVSGICEMYLWHYIFMNQAEYTKATGRKFKSNAYLVTLKKHSPGNINRVSRDLVKTGAIETVVSTSSNWKLLGGFTGSLNEVILILILIQGCYQ